MIVTLVLCSLVTEEGEIHPEAWPMPVLDLGGDTGLIPYVFSVVWKKIG
jgi:hypothetical protein